MFTESVMPSKHLILCRPLLILPSIFPSIKVFSNKLTFHIRCPKYWSFSISPSNEYSELISFKIDWFDLAVQGTLKNLLQHHSSKASVLWHSAFFMVQLSHSYMTTGKIIALSRWTFVGKVMSLLSSLFILYDRVNLIPGVPSWLKVQLCRFFPFVSAFDFHVHSCFSCVLLCASPWTVAHQAPLFTGFSK